MIQIWIRFDDIKLHACMHDKKGEGATKFSVESVWKCQDLLISAQMTGRVKGNQIQCWISLEMSEPPLHCTHDNKGEGATKFSVESVWKWQSLLSSAHMTERVGGYTQFSLESDLNQFQIRSESVLDLIWISFETDLNQFWLRFQMYILFVAEYCQLPGNGLAASEKHFYGT